MTTAVRISNFVLNRYPPVLSGVYALAFGAGGIGLFAALAGDRISADAIPMLGIVAVTLYADLMIMRVLDDISYSATDRSGEAVTIDEAYVQKHVGDLAKNTDLSKFIL